MQDKENLYRLIREKENRKSSKNNQDSKKKALNLSVFKKYLKKSITILQ